MSHPWDERQFREQELRKQRKGLDPEIARAQRIRLNRKRAQGIGNTGDCDDDGPWAAADFLLGEE